MIKRVPKGEVPKFMFRMVVTRKAKANGEPRRTCLLSTNKPIGRYTQAKRLFN